MGARVKPYYGAVRAVKGPHDMEKDTDDKPVARLKPSNCQPSEAELDQHVRIDATLGSLLQTSWR